jgi:HEPN domain-containing protein
MNSKIQCWLDIADYDLETAKAMLKTKRYLYVGFMCHQVIEKGLWAYYVYALKETPPYTHNLMYLSEKGGPIEFLTIKQ